MNCFTLWGKDSFLLSRQKNRARTPNTVARKTFNEMKKAKIIPPGSYLDADDLPYDHHSEDLENHGGYHHGSTDGFRPERFQILRIQNADQQGGAGREHGKDDPGQPRLRGKYS
jgi:hypothetical protein